MSYSNSLLYYITVIIWDIKTESLAGFFFWREGILSQPEEEEEEEEDDDDDEDALPGSLLPAKRMASDKEDEDEEAHEDAVVKQIPKCTLDQKDQRRIASEGCR